MTRIHPGKDILKSYYQRIVEGTTPEERGLCPNTCRILMWKKGPNYNEWVLVSGRNISPWYEGGKSDNVSCPIMKSFEIMNLPVTRTIQVEAE